MATAERQPQVDIINRKLPSNTQVRMATWPPRRDEHKLILLTLRGGHGYLCLMAASLANLDKL